MDKRDIDLIEQHIGDDGELKVLWDEHLEFERQLEKLESKSFRTPAEDTEMKELKKKKLAGKTKLETVLRKYRAA
jgi:uncharacterized protein YdcH (DUF465 family)